MAEELTDIAFNVTIGGQERAIKSLSDLKKAKKDATDAAIKGDQEAAKSLAALTDKMDDLKDATKSLTGSGVERASQGFNLLGEGIRNLDFDKVKVGFGAMKTAIGGVVAAAGLGLLISGITYLVENFTKLSEGSGILARTLRGIADVFGVVKDAVYEFTDALGLTNSELDKQGEAIKTYSESVNAALQGQLHNYDALIKVAKAEGKSTIEYEKAKQQAIIDTNVQVVKQIEAFVRAGGVLDEEKRKLLTASLGAIKDAKVEERIIEITDQKEKSEQWKAYLKEKNDFEMEAHRQTMEYRKAREKELDDFRRQIETQWQADQKAIQAEFYQSTFDNRAKDAKDEEVSLYNRAEIEKKLDKESMDRKRQNVQNSLSIAQGANGALIALNNLLTQTENQNRKKGDKEQKELMKKQFERNKAIGIVTAVINTATAVMAQIGNPTPYVGLVLGALAAVTGAIQIATIASQEFNGDSGSGGASDAASALSGASALPGGGTATAPAPVIQGPNNTVTKINVDDDTAKKMGPTVIIENKIVETEVTDKQKGVAKIEETAKIG